MEYILHIFVIAGIYVILTLSLNLIVGYTGVPALGHGAFSCVGAYASALLAMNHGVSPWLGMLAGAMMAAVLGFGISFVSVRLKGDYLALATFGFAVIVHSIAKNWVGVTRGPMGLPGIPTFTVFGFVLSNAWSFVLLVGVFVGITYLVLERIVNSPFGRVLRAIREDEVATAVVGKDVQRHKTIVFVVGAFFAGIAGSLYAHYIAFIDPSSFTVMESITILLMVVFGGMGSLTGSFLGAVVLVVFPELLRFLGMPSSVAAPLRQMIYGLLLVLLMLWRPQGILGKFKWQ
jgi:branched-chain amino acid transport system permease protein